MCTEQRVDKNKGITQCFLDGVTHCNESKTCNECVIDDFKWRESWLIWDELIGLKLNTNQIYDRPVKSRLVSRAIDLN